MVPNGIPRVGQDVSKRMVVGLAWQNIPIGLDAHAIQRGRASFDAQIGLGWVELAILGRCVPDEPLPAFGCLLEGHIENGLQLALCEAGANAEALT